MAGGAEDIDAEFVGIELEVDLLGLGEDGDRHRGGVDAALGLRDGDALDAVDAGLEAHEAPGAVATQGERDGLDAAQRGVREFHDLDAPATYLGVAAVHPVEVGDEERGLVTAGAGADFDDDVLALVGVWGEDE